MKAGIIDYRYYKFLEEDRNIYNDAFNNLLSEKIIVTNHEPVKGEEYSILLNHTNLGKDIGAKLIGIDYLLETKAEIDVLFLLHDKRSPHSPLGNLWFKELTQIFQPGNLSLIENVLVEDKVGICCSKKYINSEYSPAKGSFETSNNTLLQKAIQEYKLEGAKPFHFVAGTIFCCKWKPLQDFFTRNNPLKIRETLEKGNVQDVDSGTHTHSWERLFSWIITSRGYSIKGL